MGNFKEAKKYHFIYKTTNLLNGKYYIGMHSTSNLNDGYLGSGKRLKYSIRKYGKQNFKCEVLEYCSDFNSLKERERQLVNETTLSDKLCMNLMRGGIGGFVSDKAQLKRSTAANKKLNYLLNTNNEFRQSFCKRVREGLKTVISEGKYKPFESTRYNWNGKHHKEESKKKIGLTNSIKQKGNLNSQFGKCWITNGIENKKIYRGELIPTGWRLGRTIITNASGKPLGSSGKVSRI